jgi:hypothetical protein
MAISVGSLNYNQITYPALNSDIVSGSELKQVSSDIFAAAPSVQTEALNNSLTRVDFTKYSNVDTGIKLFGSGQTADINTVKKMATNMSGYNVNLSENTLKSIEALKANAAIMQGSNLSVKMDGKVIIQPPVTESQNTQKPFALNPATQLFETTDLNRDRRGPNPFFVVPVNKKDKSEEEPTALSIFG